MCGKMLRACSMVVYLYCSCMTLTTSICWRYIFVSYLRELLNLYRSCWFYFREVYCILRRLRPSSELVDVLSYIPFIVTAFLMKVAIVERTNARHYLKTKDESSQTTISVTDIKPNIPYIYYLILNIKSNATSK